MADNVNEKEGPQECCSWRRGVFKCVALIAVLGVATFREEIMNISIVDMSATSIHKAKNGTRHAPILWSYERLQKAIDDYTSGSWVGDNWNGSSFAGLETKEDILWALQNLTKGDVIKIGFMGDSTTRSDLRAWEEEFGCPRSPLDEKQNFQRLGPDDQYICQAYEQSMNLTKCGIPPIVNVTDCPFHTNLSFRYFYKIYPWTPLDEWFLERPEYFQDVQVMVISLGRWFYWRQNEMNVTADARHFLQELKRVYNGTILYQSEYAGHTTAIDESNKELVNCPHKPFGADEGTQYECRQTINVPRPQHDFDLRVVMEEFQIPYLDRWNISSTLPMEHYRPWLCGKTFHPWFCDHHLGFVAMQHMRLIAHVLQRIMI